jgi:hypothetical protein
MSAHQFQASRDFGNLVCKALGLDAGKITSIDIHITVNSVVTVSVETIIDQAEGIELIKGLSLYKLVPLEPNENAAVPVG